MGFDVDYDAPTTVEEVKGSESSELTNEEPSYDEHKNFKIIRKQKGIKRMKMEIEPVKLPEPKQIMDSAQIL